MNLRLGRKGQRVAQQGLDQRLNQQLPLDLPARPPYPAAQTTLSALQRFTHVADETSKRDATTTLGRSDPG